MVINLIYYHGTTDLFLKSIEEKGIVPGINLMENRKSNLDLVFLTRKIEIAEAYGMRASLKVGGTPIVLECGFSFPLDIERQGRIIQYSINHIPIGKIRNIYRSNWVKNKSQEEILEEMVRRFKANA